MNVPYYVKAIYAALLTFIGSLGAALAQLQEGAGIGDVTTLGWVLILGTTLAAGGGILGLQAAPAKVSTSIS